jgi:excisionase family DNA binding protein
MHSKPFADQRIGDVDLPRVYSTGQVARICGVAMRTVIKWIEEDHSLAAYTVPSSRDRRIKRADLVAFLKERGLWRTIPLVSLRLLGLATFDEAMEVAKGGGEAARL